jgi:hypothetical protein
VERTSGAVVDAIADELIIEIDRYEQLLAQLWQCDCSDELLEKFAEAAERVCRCVRALPRPPLPFTDFLISRAELIQGLQHCSGRSDPTGSAVLRLLGDHSAAADRLRRAAHRARQDQGGMPQSGKGAASALSALQRRAQPASPDAAAPTRKEARQADSEHPVKSAGTSTKSSAPRFHAR